MNVLVDTSVWSLSLRRGIPKDEPSVRELAALIEESRIVMIGAIRQELLSGVRTDAQFTRLRDGLRAFDDLVLEIVDYEEAARCFNQCRQKGVQGSNTDFLLCAIARNRKLSLFTSDKDFDRFAKILGVQLHNVRNELR